MAAYNADLCSGGAEDAKRLEAAKPVEKQKVAVGPCLTPLAGVQGNLAMLAGISHFKRGAGGVLDLLTLMAHKPYDGTEKTERDE